MDVGSGEVLTLGVVKAKFNDKRWDIGVKALSEENSEYLRWRRAALINPEKSREINGGEIRSRRADKVIDFSLTMPAEVAE